MKQVEKWIFSKKVIISSIIVAVVSIIGALYAILCHQPRSHTVRMYDEEEVPSI